MKDLMQRVKKECADGYFSAPYYKIQPFGATSEESKVIYQACFPTQNHFSRFWTKINPSIPEPLQRLVEDCDCGLSQKITANPDGSYNIEYFRDQLYLFQYPLNIGRITSYVKDEFIKPGFDIDCPELTRATSKEFLKSFKRRFRGGSCIYMKFTGAKEENARHVPQEEQDHRRDLNIPLIIGKRNIMYEIMGFLKQQPQNIFNFFHEVTVEKERWAARYLEDNTKNVHIYDLLCKPKEVHFTLGQNRKILEG